ncbi:MAG: hypothetical protein M0R74_03385 [Dehalococcoidia bacterium]|nr:hypothetical protein [Dehalococcoidia bacterium]
MPGPAPKPANLRQRRNKKAGAVTLPSPENTSDTKKKVPSLQNPDKRKFHKLTRKWWRRVWESPMAGEYLPTDIDGLARLAILIDNYYQNPAAKNAKELLGEVRLQEARFGLSPIDRSRLQWEVMRGEEAEKKRKPPQQNTHPHKADPRGILGVVE